ncbi:phosphatidylglycerophosphatase A family protein [Legionella pneumophila]|uniref:Phosphatidylglycerophosphatase A n=1 Tax=Legionella pneumophila subsp. pascullei TaxID=91890 RepID=A0AAX2IW99_LEGPN|nr:phosphatidylglycerophosphatase A [Legionella pneumophila]AMP91754.1 phosphatidylglycerophosphatase [Legionella pneumophila subsp. pascullei]SQG89568.1 phosphatidylglycerophosphatase A [Legionella pneumophila subsp. pascullei]VEH04969.1 phosphatidylglycerophosphatase A [Legionella pneumophila subsp. pascullei]HAU3862589.1 phosphatidylglycerophosphatase A [Legionella pneumophila]HDU8261327.1 phosphatidylglycerophosphatase A [Legionella pneumophila]
MNQVNLANRVWQDPIYFIAFGFGSGLMSIAPGTWGTLAAVPLYLLMINAHWSVYLLWTALAFVLGVWVSDKVTEDLGVHDYKGIVWDEVVGYLLTMFLAPKGISWMLTGFILFRIFDIWKPQPIRAIDQKVQGGLGIMLDDVLAAVPAWCIMQILVWSFA